MSTWKRILVTSALPYANGAVHLGHLAGAYLPADIYTRYQRLAGREVAYICGSDEHGVSILISAAREGVQPRDIIDRYHEQNARAFERAGIDFDNYSRTSLAVHHDTAREWFLELHEKGILKQSTERQLFDEEVGMFLPDRFVVGVCPHCGYDRAYGDQCEQCSKYYAQTELVEPKSLLSGSTPVARDAQHWYFPLGDFQKRLEEYVEEHAADWKPNVLQQVRSWLKAGLSDRPITRDLAWGIPAPLQESQGKVLYVWFEAVLGYISATKEWAAKIGEPDKWKDYWQDPEGTRYIAFIGKDNIVFHCLMFPAMLMARGGYVLPDNVPANEFLNLQGRKFAKSLNWSIELNSFLDVFPADPMRYALASIMPETRDSDFTLEDFQARNNNELAAILGNFVNRTLQFAIKNFDAKVPRNTAPGVDDWFSRARSGAVASVGDLIEKFRFKDALQEAMVFARSCNKYFNDRAPWVAVKKRPEHAAETIARCLDAVLSLSILCEPFMPFSARKIRHMLKLEAGSALAWSDAENHALQEGHPLGAPELLFRRIEDHEIASALSGLNSGSESPEPPAPAIQYPPLKEQISYEQFSALDLRVGIILEAERVPKSKKLLRLLVDIGIEKRRIVAGIGTAYDPAGLAGMKIVVVANLKPAVLFGIESQGMLLAASEEGGPPVLLTVESDTPHGGVVR